MNAGCCCWLLLLILAVDCCCWLLLLVAAAGCGCWFLLLVEGWLLLIAAGWDTACWRESLWIFPGYWWFAAKTILQAKKFLNFFAELMRKVDLMRILFQIHDEIEVEKRYASGKQASKRMNKMREYGVFIPCYVAIE